MWPPAADSSGSGELPAGTLVAGFRIERLLGHGPQATVYEATQLSLQRRVALKVLHDRALASRVLRLTWPEHPGAVSLFAAGDGEHGPWLAMRLMPAATLATTPAPLNQVAAALEHAHARGIVHGGVTAGNIFVAAGRAYLSDWGLGPEDATADDDRAAFARLVRQHPRPAPRRRRALRAGAAGAAAAVATGALLVTGRGDTGGHERAPSAPAGTRPVGSDLAPGGVESVDCAGRPPDGSSRACTVSPLALAGRPVTVPADGTVTSWAVRGARGTLALQILRRQDGGLVQIARSADARIPGPAVRVVGTRIAVAAGDRVGLLLYPGAAVGIRRGRAPATTERWFGPLLAPARRPERPAGTGFDRELLLRVDVGPRAGAEAIAPVRGAAAARAPAGRRLAAIELDVGRGEVRTATIVTLGGAVAVDLLDGRTRLARAPVRGADGRGELVGFTPGLRAVRVRWLNPGGAPVTRTIPVTAGGLG